MSTEPEEHKSRIVGRENAIKLELIRKIMSDWFEEANDAAEDALMAIQEIVDDDDIIGNIHAYSISDNTEKEIERNVSYPEEVTEGNTE